jgi:hypothetical protein
MTTPPPENERPGTGANGSPAREICKGCLHGKNYITSR